MLRWKHPPPFIYLRPLRYSLLSMPTFLAALIMLTYLQFNTPIYPSSNIPIYQWILIVSTLDRPVVLHCRTRSACHSEASSNPSRHLSISSHPPQTSSPTPRPRRWNLPPSRRSRPPHSLRSSPPHSASNDEQHLHRPFLRRPPATAVCISRPRARPRPSPNPSSIRHSSHSSYAMRVFPCLV